MVKLSNFLVIILLQVLVLKLKFESSLDLKFWSTVSEWVNHPLVISFVLQILEKEKTILIELLIFLKDNLALQPKNYIYIIHSKNILKAFSWVKIFKYLRGNLQSIT